MKSDRLIRPGRRRPTASTRPSHAGSAYPVSDWIIPPSDARGRSSSITVGITPAMQRMGTIVLSLKTLPFETAQDVWRWCLHHGLAKLATMVDDKDLTSEFSTMQSWVAVRAQQLEYLYYEKHLKEIISAVRKLAAAGHMVKAIQLAEMVWRQSDRIGDPHWSEQYRDTMKRTLDSLRRQDRRVAERRAEPEGKTEDED